jgi:hypothetical protein
MIFCCQRACQRHGSSGMEFHMVLCRHLGHLISSGLGLEITEGGGPLCGQLLPKTGWVRGSQSS